VFRFIGAIIVNEAGLLLAVTNEVGFIIKNTVFGL